MITPSLLRVREVPITEQIGIINPSVAEILDMGESLYYQVISMLVSTPYEMMVQLNDMHIDFERITQFDLFITGILALNQSLLRLVLQGIDPTHIKLALNEEGHTVLRDEESGAMIDSSIHRKIVDILRKIHFFEVHDKKPANQEAKDYMIERARKKLQRRSKQPYKPYLEPLIVALVNTPEFKYDYDGAMRLNIFQFNASVKQIQKRINYSHLMQGCYAGTVDISKLDRQQIDWLS